MPDSTPQATPLAIELLASVAREVATAEKPAQALHAVLVAVRSAVGASGVALLRLDPSRLVPVESVGMRISRGRLEAPGGEAEGVLPLVLGGRVEGGLLVRGIEPDELAHLEMRLAPLLELSAAALRNARLADEHGRLAAIMSSADDAFISTELDGTITTWNTGAERLYGYTAEQIVGRSASVLLPGERTAKLRGLLKRVGQGEQIPQFETVLRSRDGDAVDISVSVAALESSPGDVVGAAFVAREMTSWKRALQAQQLLAEASALLSSTLDYEAALDVVPRAFVPALGGCCVLDVLEPNETLRTISFADGGERGAILRTLLQERVGGRAETRPLAEVMRTGKVVLVKQISEGWLASLNRTAGELALITQLEAHSVLSAPLRAGDRIIGCLTLGATPTYRPYDSMDVPLVEELAQRAALALENARLYREAQQAVELRDQVLSSVSHDLRSPLTAILTEAALLGRAAGGIDDCRLQIARGSELIQSSVMRMNGWIGDLLDVAQLEAGAELHLNLAPVDLAALVRNAAAEQHQASRGQAVIRLDDVVDSLPAVLDESRFRRVLDNLLGNAVKYTPASGTIRVCLVREEVAGQPSGVLTVDDDGMGIPADDLPRILEPYQRASNVGAIRGTGLGLAGARAIVQQHGGTLVVDSTEGDGTRVTVRLPLEPRLR